MHKERKAATTSLQSPCIAQGTIKSVQYPQLMTKSKTISEKRAIDKKEKK